MSEDETTTLAEVPAEVETKVYEWTVLRRRDNSDNEGRPHWVEVGTIETETSYYIGWDAPQEIGLLGGPGEYLLIHAGHVERMILTAVTRYRKVDEDEVDEEES